MADEVLLRLELTCDERAPHEVRSSLSALEEVRGCAQDLLLVASELVTNALLHSGCSRCDRLGVRLLRRDGGYVLSVTDPGRSGKSAGKSPPRAPGDGGLGLRIVEMLAARWGETRGPSYEVWAELAA